MTPEHMKTTPEDIDLDRMKDDTISRQAAINAIFGRSHEIIKMRIGNLPSAQPEQRWIPCSERPPKESGTYTVTAYNGATNRVTYAKYQKRLKRWELTGARAYWRVVAWMPLPKGYKGE